MTTAKSYDKLNRLAGMISTPSGGGQLPFSYGASYNEANQRITVTMNDGSYWVYEYDTLGQITSAKKHFANGTFVPSQQFFFSFDHIGNRTTDALPTESCAIVRWMFTLVLAIPDYGMGMLQTSGLLPPPRGAEENDSRQENMNVSG